MTNKTLKQQSRPSGSIPTQPLIRTIGQGSLPPVPTGAPQVFRVDRQTTPVEWNSACWHDGAD